MSDIAVDREKAVITLSGPLAETFAQDRLERALDEISERSPEVTVNVERVKRGNSVGVAKFFTALSRPVPRRKRLRGCSSWMMGELNAAGDLLSEAGVVVDSFHATFVDESGKHPTDVVIEVDADFLGKVRNGSTFEMARPGTGPLHPDFDPGEYFEFLRIMKYD